MTITEYRNRLLSLHAQLRTAHHTGRIEAIALIEADIALLRTQYIGHPPS